MKRRNFFLFLLAAFGLAPKLKAAPVVKRKPFIVTQITLFDYGMRYSAIIREERDGKKRAICFLGRICHIIEADQAFDYIAARQNTAERDFARYKDYLLTRLEQIPFGYWLEIQHDQISWLFLVCDGRLKAFPYDRLLGEGESFQFPLKFAA